MALPALPKHLQNKIIPHAAKVCQLYKACLMEIRSQNPQILEYRYQAVLLRARFEEHSKEIDMIKAKKLLEDGYKELQSKRFPIPLRYPNDPGGVAYGRHEVVPDYILDCWHPLEKAQYPDYFARRDERKKEYIERWEAKYGKSTPGHGHH